MPLFKGRDEINALFTLNKMESRIFELIDGKRSLGQLRDIVLEKYKVERSRLEHDLENFIKDAMEINIIQRVKK